MAFGGRDGFGRKRTPFLDDRVETVKWNYAERNADGYVERNQHLSQA